MIQWLLFIAKQSKENRDGIYGSLEVCAQKQGNQNGFYDLFVVTYWDPEMAVEIQPRNIKMEAIFLKMNYEFLIEYDLIRY